MIQSRSAAFAAVVMLIACLAAGCVGRITGVGFNAGGGGSPGVTAGGGGGGPAGPGLPVYKEALVAPGAVIVGYHPGADVEAIAQAVNAEVVPSKLDLIGAAYLRLKGADHSVDDVVRTLQEMEGVRYAEPDYIVYRVPYERGGLPGGIGALSLGMPNDPHFATHQYGPQKIGAPEVWAAGYTGEGVIVAVIDTGIDESHPEFAGRLLPGVTVLYPYVYFFGAPPIDDHGTLVAGVIAAAKDNGVGIAGVAPGARIFPIRVFHRVESGEIRARVVDVAVGILVAAAPEAFGLTHGRADVVNLSLGIDGYVQVLTEAVEFALRQGVVVVTSAGNTGHDEPVRSPATIPGVLAVAATDAYDRVASFSNAADFISVAAPGVMIWTTDIGGSGYGAASGTSFSAPHVAGAAALLLEARPGLAPEDVKYLIEETADPIQGRNVRFGRINVARALALALSGDDWDAGVGAIAVKVQDDKGAEIFDADVVLYRGDKALATALSSSFWSSPFGEFGVAVFRNLEPGDDYWVTVRLDEKLHGQSVVEKVTGIRVEAGKFSEVSVVIPRVM